MTTMEYDDTTDPWIDIMGQCPYCNVDLFRNSDQEVPVTCFFPF